MKNILKSIAVIAGVLLAIYAAPAILSLVTSLAVGILTITIVYLLFKGTLYIFNNSNKVTK